MSDLAVEGCTFCEIIAGKTEVPILGKWAYAMAFKPLNPVTPGHVLVVARPHVVDAGVSAYITASCFEAAAVLGRTHESYNLITSVGTAATQSVRHLHVHMVPRVPEDQLKLPWTDQVISVG